MSKLTTIIIVSMLIGFLFGCFIYELTDSLFARYQCEFDRNFRVEIEDNGKIYKVYPNKILGKILELTIENHKLLK